MKKKKKPVDKRKRRPGRPSKPATDCMIPMSVSVPIVLRDLIDKLADDGGASRSTVAVDLLERGLRSKRVAVPKGGRR